MTALAAPSPRAELRRAVRNAFGAGLGFRTALRIARAIRAAQDCAPARVRSSRSNPTRVDALDPLRED